MSTQHENRSTAQPLRAQLSGILLPFTTPFKEGGSPDLEALRTNLTAWNQTPIKGYVTLGSTGERVHLNERECVEVIQNARSEVANDRAFIVGVGQQSTHGTIHEIESAVKAGADAVLVLTPYFYRSSITQEALLSHYNTIADASSVPVVLYSMPALTGITIQPETVARLSQHQNIIGVKDSSADVQEFRRTVEMVRAQSTGEDFAILSGNGTVLLDCLKVGADGAVLAVGCVAPQLCVDILNACGSEDLPNAELLQRALTPLARAVTTEYGIGGLKAAMDLAGYKGGFVRAPLRMPNESERARIAEVLKAAWQFLNVPTPMS